MDETVAKDLSYDRSVDVYSFGIMLWEMSSLEKPFAGYSCKKHMKEVVIGEERPKMDTSHTAHWPVDLQWLMKSSWSTDTELRPTFTVIVDTLQNVSRDLQRPMYDRVRSHSEGSAPHESSATGPTVSPARKTPRAWKTGRLVSRS